MSSTYKLPPAFYWDHTYRDLPEEGTSRLVRETKRAVFVELDQPAYADLLSDSEHYASCGTEVFGLDRLGLCTSARATHRALVAAGPPE